MYAIRPFDAEDAKKYKYDKYADEINEILSEIEKISREGYSIMQVNVESMKGEVAECLEEKGFVVTRHNLYTGEHPTFYLIKW